MLPTELEFVWSAERVFTSSLNMLYIVQRYMPFIDTIGLLYALSFAAPIDPKTCHILYGISAWMYFVGIALTEIVLTLRTWALWGKDIRLSIALPIYFLCCWLPILYINHIFVKSHTFVPSPDSRTIGCVILGGKPIFFLVWVLLMIYEAGILILMLIPGFNFLRMGRWSALTTVIYRDGITYYILLFAFAASNVVIILLLPSDLENLLSPYQRVMQTLLTSRAILHMRSQSRKLSSTTARMAILVTQERSISGLDDEEHEELEMLNVSERTWSRSVSPAPSTSQV
ncbi:hypothetical protein GYMLUDRAFT_427817 [Collybiopsis luxurians FD-317 M1]|uniref:Uncharacterized protein n=1 Tax=Collybiopsis luxurians FD-317 M1 TaxID=944289 RepID=A0A0D0CW93_9AGAR|nr:hypothetical protein GYMLUDRAFT_427817 [Collybiopsis luxurians FD-317 M1]